MGGRKVDFISADTGGNPAGTKTKAQELVERDKVDVILGPLAAFELYAISDYIKEQKMPTLSLAAADNLTQRQPNPFLLRASATSSQAMHPMGHYAATELKLKRIVLHLRRFRLRLRADGRLSGGLPARRRLRRQQTVAAAGHARLHALRRADRDCDGVCQGFAGSNPIRFMKQYASRRSEISGGGRRNRRR
jgi:branched-chain amino acid transport system substrate-binding protein